MIRVKTLVRKKIDSMYAAATELWSEKSKHCSCPSFPLCFITRSRKREEDVRTHIGSYDTAGTGLRTRDDLKDVILRGLCSGATILSHCLKQWSGPVEALIEKERERETAGCGLQKFFFEHIKSALPQLRGQRRQFSLPSYHHHPSDDDSRETHTSGDGPSILFLSPGKEKCDLSLKFTSPSFSFIY